MKNKQSRKPAYLGGRPFFEKPIPITQPTLPPAGKLATRYERIIESRMITNASSVKEFEARAARHLGVRQAVAVSSCTSGLMLIMKALGLKGEVILPGFTFHATAHAAVWNGLRPVFVDCDPCTFNVNPKCVERAITPETSAIIGVHIFGNPADIAALEKISKNRGLKLLFDAAHGFGALYKGRPVGGFGNAESFSLSPTKLVTCGEGGIVATNDDNLAAKIRVGRNYGDPGSYDCDFSGLNARMSEFNALLGIESLKMLKKNVARRNKLASLYKRRLRAIPGIAFQDVRSDDRSSYKDFALLVDPAEFGMSRDRLHAALQEENISVKDYFDPPVHQQKAFAAYGQAKKPLPRTEAVSQNILSLPMFSHLHEDTVARICEAVKDIHLAARAFEP